MPELPRPLALPDETIDCFLLRFERLQGFPTTTLATLARDPRVRINPFGQSSGHKRTWGSIALAGFDDDRKIDLSMARLFQPVSFLGGVPRPHEHMSYKDAREIRTTPAHCVCCTKEDLSCGYSYWRRQFQVRANIYCLEHGFTVLSGCPSCGVAFSNDHLPGLSCSSCGASLMVDTVFEPETPAARVVFHRIARATTGLLSGKLTGALDLDRIRARANSMVSCRTSGHYNNVARYICERVGRRTLAAIGLDPGEPPQLGWPAVYLSGRFGRSSPSIELMLFGVFGETDRIQEYWCRTERAQAEFELFAWHLLDGRFLRCLYHSADWPQASLRVQRSLDTTQKVYQNYPGLTERIGRFRKRRAVARANTGAL